MLWISKPRVLHNAATYRTRNGLNELAARQILRFGCNRELRQKHAAVYDRSRSFPMNSLRQVPNYNSSYAAVCHQNIASAPENKCWNFVIAANSHYLG